MNTRKWSIAGLMGTVLFVAVWLSITRLHDPALAGYWLLGIVVAIALHWAWFILVPRWSLEIAGGDRDRQSGLLRWIIDTPIPGGPKVRARYLLAENDQAAGRYAEAATGFRSILRDTGQGMDLSPNFESTLRQHLADTLEALGHLEEAEVERERSGAAHADADEYFADARPRATEPAGRSHESPSEFLACDIAAPTPDMAMLHARYKLATRAQVAKRYHEAEGALRSILRESSDGMALPPGFE
jgi:hypothetical protein